MGPRRGSAPQKGALYKLQAFFMRQFQTVNIKKMAFTKADNIYWVYKSKNDFVEIEAESAFDAIKKSQINSPYKIIQAKKILNNLVIPPHLLAEVSAKI
jgi:hypothetical protein